MQNPKPLVGLCQLGVLCPLACYFGWLEMLNVLDNMALKLRAGKGGGALSPKERGSSGWLSPK